jgi:hypothetical protein
MTYLQSLKAAKEAREEYERDELRLKEIIFKINQFHSVYDGQFLRELENFMDGFQTTNTDRSSGNCAKA